MARAHLYFIANPALGIIKIGVSQDVKARRKTLELQCGVRLDVLRVVEHGAHFEQLLHEALYETRLLGEWFEPSSELLSVIAGDESIERFLERVHPVVAQRKVESDARLAEERAARAAEKAELKRLEAAHAKERERVKRERAARREERQAAKAARAAERMEALRRQWNEGNAEVITVRADDAAAARDRRERLLLTQRGRNAALLGLGKTAGARQ